MLSEKELPSHGLSCPQRATELSHQSPTPRNTCFLVYPNKMEHSAPLHTVSSSTLSLIHTPTSALLNTDDTAFCTTASAPTTKAATHTTSTKHHPLPAMCACFLVLWLSRLVADPFSNLV
jgi:hypothetical protein